MNWDTTPAGLWKCYCGWDDVVNCYQEPPGGVQCPNCGGKAKLFATGGNSFLQSFREFPERTFQ